MSEPLHPHLMVIVDQGGQPWAGEVTFAGLFDTSPVAVVCTDPLDNPDLVRGMWFVVPRAQVAPVFRPGRWSR